MAIRKAEFSGSWYPASARQCEREINNFLDLKLAQPIPEKAYQGGIVPHAGWYFSGAIACNVIHLLSALEAPDVIVLFGMHLHSHSSYYIMPEGGWETPFGPIDVEPLLSEELVRRFRFKIETPTQHMRDNTIELQLPFIKYFFPHVKIVAMGVPPVAASLEIASETVKIAKALGLCIKVVGSTDLTHYGPNYDFTDKGTGQVAVDWVRGENDRSVISCMLEMDPAAVIKDAADRQNACCSGAAAAAIAASKTLGSEKAQLVAYATSYDKAPGDSFVGYVGIAY